MNLEIEIEINSCSNWTDTTGDEIIVWPLLTC